MTRASSGLILSVAVFLVAVGPLVSLHAAPPELVVKRDRITAGLLATIIPSWAEVEPSTVLGYAPRPGVNREVGRAELLRWGRNQGLELDSETLPDSLLVRRATRRLSRDEAEKHFVQALATTHEVSADMLSVEFTDFRPPLVPGGELDFDIPSRGHVLNRTAPFSLRWRDVDGRTGQVVLRASVSIEGTFAIAREDIPAGTELTGSAFDFHTGPLPGEPERFAISEDEIMGTKLRGSLRAGQSLDRRLLAVSETIERGDLIQIRVQAGAVVLQTPAAAEESGSVGDIIRCRNLDSGRRVSARVISPKLAEVAAR